MRESILFSVIIPTYNRGDRIKKAVQSILAQIYQNFEIIIVDDGGYDETKSIIESFNDTRIKYFWKENEERSIARNFGIEKSVGDYVCFLDSDDYWLENHLIEAYNNIVINFPKVYHASFQFFYEKENKHKIIQVSNVTVKRLLKDNFLHCNAVAIRKDVIQDVRFIHSRDAIISEDHYLWLILAARYSFVCSSKITVVVVEHDLRSLNNVNPDKAAKSFDIIFRHLDNEPVFKTGELKREYKQFKASNYLLLALFYSLQKRSRASFHFIIKAVELHWIFIFSKRFAAILYKLVLKL